MMTRRILGPAVAIVLALAPAAQAQLAEPGKTDQFVGVFLQDAGDEVGWIGGVTSRGGFDFPPRQRLHVGWQLDYGSHGKRETASGLVPKKEPDVSKNSGAYTVGYQQRFGAMWLIGADGGIEHKRATTTAADAKDNVGFLGNASIRNVGSRKLGDGQGYPQLDWALKLNLATADAIASDGTDTRELFVDPVAVLWLSFWPHTIPASGAKPPFLTYWFVVRAQAGAMRPFDEALDTEGQWEASLTFFFTPNSGIMVRRFDGHFEHNLRDRKRATTVNVVWKFD
jgi:hypothetical protein